MGTDSDSGKLIRRLLEDPETIRYCPDVREPSFFFQSFLPFALSVSDSRPADGESLARLALEIAPDSCGAVQGLGLMAQCQRALGDISGAHLSLQKAERIAELCSTGACYPDVFRRQALVLLFEKRFSKAEDLANDAIREYRQLGHAGHDLDGNGLASSLDTRAQIRYYAGEKLAALADEQQALSLTCPKTSPTLFRTVLVNLSVFLAALGGRENLQCAEGYLAQARRLFQKIPGLSQERAKLAWITAMVRRELGRIRPARAREILSAAQEDFLELGMVEEAVAVTADLARAAYPHRNRVRDILSDALKRLRSVLKEQHPELWASLVQARQAVDVPGWHNAEELLKSAIESLREACGPHMMACLITWRDDTV